MVNSKRIWLARSIAVAADVVQIAISPVFIQGAASPFEDGLDLLVGVLLTVLVGWHIAFLPSFIVKLFPVVDLAPTWTIAVLIATRKTDSPSSPPQLP